MPKPARTSCGISYLPVHDTGMDTVRESPLPPSTPSAWLNSLARDVFPRVGNVAVARSTAPMYWRSSPLLAQDADRPADASAHPPFPLARGQGSCSSATRAGPPRDSRHLPGAPLSSRRGRDAHTHMPARAAWKFPERKSERRRSASSKVRAFFLASGFWLLASGFWLLAARWRVSDCRQMGPEAENASDGRMGPRDEVPRCSRQRRGREPRTVFMHPFTNPLRKPLVRRSSLEGVAEVLNAEAWYWEVRTIRTGG